MDARTATTVAASPAIATLAPNLQQSTLDAFEQLRCELGALDAMSPMASPLATLDGNLPRMLGASPALHKAPESNAAHPDHAAQPVLHQLLAHRPQQAPP